MGISTPAKFLVPALVFGICVPVYAELNVNIDVPVSLPPRTPVTMGQPAQQVYDDAAPPTVVLEQPPQLIYSPELGYYVAVGIPHEMVFIDGNYYIHRHGRWFLSPTYDGVWLSVAALSLPERIRSHSWEQIRTYRDREYAVYRRDPSHYDATHHAG